MDKISLARELFLAGANCAQAIAGAFSEDIGMTQEQAMKLASGFGGGIARMREVCGVISGIVLVVNILDGNGDISDKAHKDDQYARLQPLIKAFQETEGSILCRELLKLAAERKNSPISEERTASYYASRPCVRLVERGAEILSNYLAQRQP